MIDSDGSMWAEGEWFGEPMMFLDRRERGLCDMCGTHLQGDATRCDDCCAKLRRNLDRAIAERQTGAVR